MQGRSQRRSLRLRLDRERPNAPSSAGRATPGRFRPPRTRLRTKARRVIAQTLQELDGVRGHLGLPGTTRTVSTEFAGTQLIQNRLGHDRARRVAGTQEQDVERAIGHVRALCRAASRRRLRHGLRSRLRLATYLLLSNTRLTLPGAVAVLRALARGEECFPCDARRIVGPGLFRLRITAGSLALFDDVAACAAQTRIDFLQFVLALNLDTEMIEARLLAAH